MESDIVARLRDIEGGYGFRAICREAADEIERLRRDYSCICGEMRRMMAERDEARRKICEIESQCICDPPRSPQKYASLMGWDCFKENTE